MSDDRIPVLFDTDIGSDLDDAVCLAYLLCQPRCELLGVVTVSGQPDKRAMMVDAMCREARAGVPVHKGLDTPREIEQKQDMVPQADALAQWRHARVFPQDAAIPFMAETIRSRPGEVTLLATGPLTDAAAQLKQIVMMCGVFGEIAGRTVEWNASLDPHALDVVCRAPVPSLTIVGLDVTSKCVMRPAVFDEHFRGGVLDVVKSFADIYFKTNGNVTFHDPLAGAVIFEPGLVSSRLGRVEVELSDANALGKTIFAEEEGGTHSVVFDVDVDGFFAHYFDTVKRAVEETPPA
jgi:purine nucleosidase